jgi:hypothetical protein
VETNAAEDRGGGPQQVEPALLASGVVLSVWVEDRHTSIFSGKLKYK